SAERAARVQSAMTNRPAMVLIAIGVATSAAAQPAQLSLYELVGRYGTRPDEVRALLAKGANPNQPREHSSDTPLDAALRAGGAFEDEGLSVIRVLVEAGADLNPRKSGDHGFYAVKSPLFVAMGKSDDIFQFLLNKGADPNLPDFFG